MAEYYLDIETHATGHRANPEKDEIITIQYQRMDTRSGESRGPLNVLKAWESSEKDILREFRDIFAPESPWNFIPVGFNLMYDFATLDHRWRLHGMDVPRAALFYEGPFLDLKHLCVLLNGGMFKGASLDKYTGKSQRGNVIREMYEKGLYSEIVGYIGSEADAFIGFYQRVISALPGVGI